MSKENTLIRKNGNYIPVVQDRVKERGLLTRALKKVLLTKDSQIYTNEGCSRFFDILHFF